MVDYYRNTYEFGISFEGNLYVGNPSYVASKIQRLKDHLGIHRVNLHIPVGPMAHEKILNTIQLLGLEVRKHIK